MSKKRTLDHPIEGFSVGINKFAEVDNHAGGGMVPAMRNAFLVLAATGLVASANAQNGWTLWFNDYTEYGVVAPVPATSNPFEFPLTVQLEAEQPYVKTVYNAGIAVPEGAWGDAPWTPKFATLHQEEGFFYYGPSLEYRHRHREWQSFLGTQVRFEELYGDGSP